MFLACVLKVRLIVLASLRSNRRTGTCDTSFRDGASSLASINTEKQEQCRNYLAARHQTKETRCRCESRASTRSTTTACQCTVQQKFRNIVAALHQTLHRTTANVPLIMARSKCKDRRVSKRGSRSFGDTIRGTRFRL